MKRLLLALFISACHPVPATAELPPVDIPANIVDMMNSDAAAVCDMVDDLTDRQECLNMMFDGYVEAIQMGAGSVNVNQSIASVIELSSSMNGCTNVITPICNAQTANWSSYYMFGQRNKEKLNESSHADSLHPN